MGADEAFSRSEAERAPASRTMTREERRAFDASAWSGLDTDHTTAIADAARAWFDQHVHCCGRDQTLPWIPRDLLNALVADYDARHPEPTLNLPPIDSSLRVTEPGV